MESRWTDIALDIREIGRRNKSKKRADARGSCEVGITRPAGGRQTFPARQALAEDLRPCPGRYSRQRRRCEADKEQKAASMAAVRLALDKEHWVECRGNAVVGRSGAPGAFSRRGYDKDDDHCAQSPARTPAKGALALRAVLGIDGTTTTCWSILPQAAVPSCSLTGRIFWPGTGAVDGERPRARGRGHTGIVADDRDDAP